ncbi:hypothetical protein DSO57_1025726 [Entomophthora muscae]|uniref:Uncharacterized protein n=1 Tax=Entomophthora muscae TaxID=34485 RepID=A0ACC2UMM0_9FUNG|nr:hypothetical protein DSO57_1025726 [Entomophthora muscae]
METLLVDNPSQSPSISPFIADSEPADSEPPPILLLFHDISDDSDMDDSDTDNFNAYLYSVLAVPKTIAVPYKLQYRKTTTTTKPLPEAKKVVSFPYLIQAKRSPLLVESSKEVAEVADALFKNISVLLHLQTVYKEFPGLRCMIKKWDKELAEAQDILAVLTPFGCTTTCIEISIQKVKIKAVLDTGSPVNVASLKLVNNLKLSVTYNSHWWVFSQINTPKYKDVLFFLFISCR